MDFTFGIITCAKTNGFIPQIIQSIEAQGIPNYEIIIVGTCNITSKACRVIPFDDIPWFTRKKNIIFQEAIYENIVVFHDYIALEEGWYEGFLKYGNNFEVCVNPIKTLTGRRYRDYVLHNSFLHNTFRENALIPYSREVTPAISRLMYISGGYYIIKKSRALKIPLREQLHMNHGEDVFFSQDLADNNIVIRCNPYSFVKILKDIEPNSWENEMSNEEFLFLKNWAEVNSIEIFNKNKDMQRKWLKDSYGIVLFD